MKKIITILVSLSFLNLYSQTIIAGKVVDPNDKDYFSSNNYIILSSFNYKKPLYLKTETFQDTISNLKSNHFILISKINRVRKVVPIYLKENDSLYINFGKSKITFSGAGKNSEKINNFLQEEKLLFSEILKSANYFFNLKENEFLKITKKHLKAVKKLIRKSKLPKEYAAFQKRKINYNYIRNLQNYEKHHRILKVSTEFKVSSKFPKNKIKKIDLNNAEDYKNSFQYRWLIKEYITENALKTKGDFENAYLNNVQQKITNDIIKNDLLFEFVKKRIQFVEDLDLFVQKYMKYSTNSYQKQVVKELFKEYEHTAKGKTSPKFLNYKTINGKNVSLDDFLNKNKKIYIGVWTTWCGFCKTEIPLLETIKEKYKNSNIDFLMLCMGKGENIEKWKKIVTDEEFGGIQLFSNENFKNSEFCKQYKIDGFPRFILIDEKGKIISRNVPRPSDGNKLNDFFEENGVKFDHKSSTNE